MAYEKVLIVGEDFEARLFLTRTLEGAGFHPTATFDAEEAIALLRRENHEVVLLDALAEADSPELCQRLRQFSDVPIIVITDRNDVYHEVISLESGADDYLTKPFPPEKLVSRVRALIRRARGRVSLQPAAPPPLTIGPLQLDFAVQKATLKGQELPLSGKEFLLLYTLAQHLGTLMSREQLSRLVWSGETPSDSKTFDVHIYRLRKKLETTANLGHLLITVRKRGYMLSAAMRDA
jgi:DNA-binding response OmpR family regulator